MKTKNALATRDLSSKLGFPLRREIVRLKQSAQAFHEDERGDNENLGRMLVLGLILIPIVIILALYGQDIVAEVKKQWNEVIGQSGKIKK